MEYPKTIVCEGKSYIVAAPNPSTLRVEYRFHVGGGEGRAYGIALKRVEGMSADEDAVRSVKPLFDEWEKMDREDAA